MGDSDKQRLFVKGAAEIVKTLCTHLISSDGSASELDNDYSSKLDEVISEFQARGLRTLCIAYRDFEGQPEWV